MYIAYVTMQFPVPSETFLSSDVKALMQLGHQVDVYGMRPRHLLHERLVKEREHENVCVENFSLSSLLHAVIVLFKKPTAVLRLLFSIFKYNHTIKHVAKSLILLPSALSIFSSIHKKKPDVVHLFWGHYPALVGELVHHYLPNTVLSQFLGAHDLIENYPLGNQLLDKVDVVFTHSQQNVPELLSRGVDIKKLQVVHRGTDTSRQILSRFNKFSSDSGLYFLTAARLIEEKGVDDVLQIFSKVKIVYPKAELAIAGDGPDLNRLQNLAQLLRVEGVRFLGHLPQQQLIVEMQKAHFFLFMSRYLPERLPNVVKEAMLQGCVVISSKTTGIEELIEHEVNGFVVKQRSIEEVVNIVTTLLVDEELMIKYSHNAIQSIKEKFDVSISMSKYVNCWSTVNG